MDKYTGMLYKLKNFKNINDAINLIKHIVPNDNDNFFHTNGHFNQIESNGIIYFAFNKYIIAKAVFLYSREKDSEEFKIGHKIGNICMIDPSIPVPAEIEMRGGETKYLDETDKEKIEKETNGILYPDEEDDKKSEGAKKQITINRYERNPEARKICIEHYQRKSPNNKIKCLVCEFDFEKIFGDIGKNFIHIHHIVPLSKLSDIERKKYTINPTEDLIPLCPNCHAMIHKNNNSTAEELKILLETVKAKNAK